MGTRCQLVDTHLHIRRAHIKSQTKSNSENEKGLLASMQRLPDARHTRDLHFHQPFKETIHRSIMMYAYVRKKKGKTCFTRGCNAIRYDTTRHVAVVTYDLLPYPYHSLARSYTRIPMRRVPAHPAHTQTQVTWLRSRRVEGD